MVEYGGIWWNMVEYRWNMVEYGGIWWNMGGIWWNMDGIWWNMVGNGGIFYYKVI